MYDDGIAPKALLGRAVLGLAVLFTVWATWRWVDVLSADFAPGAESERRARVFELACSTVVALTATGFSWRLVFRPDSSLPPPVLRHEVYDPPERDWRLEGPTINLDAGGDSVVDPPFEPEPVFIGSLDEIHRSIAARTANPKRRETPSTTTPAVDAESVDVGTEAGKVHDGSETTGHSEWVGQAMEELAHELTLINGYTDLLLAGDLDVTSEEFHRIRCAGERSSLLVQQFPFLHGNPRIARRMFDLDILVDLIQPRLRTLISPEGEFALSLHSQGIQVEGDPAVLTLVIASLVAVADRVSAGRGRVRLATGDQSLTVETTLPAGGARYTTSPSFQAVGSIVGLLGGTLAVEKNPGQISFRVSLPSSG